MDAPVSARPRSGGLNRRRFLVALRSPLWSMNERACFFRACGAGRGRGEALRGYRCAGWCRARGPRRDGVWPAGPERGGQDHAGSHSGHAAHARCGAGGGPGPRRRTRARRRPRAARPDGAIRGGRRALDRAGESGDVRPARTYSGGMRRRLDIASSLLTRPQVLFLDEPTTGLDPRSRNEIWAIVRELRRDGTTLLLTTQYLEEADQLADRIAVIDRGKVIAEGTGNELKDRVGGQILEVELASVGQRDRAQAVLAGVGCGEPEPDERPDRLTPPAPRNGLLLVEEAAAELRRAQIGVSDIGLRRPTLDDVFLQLTGAAPSEDGDRPRQAAAKTISAPRRPVLRGAAPIAAGCALGDRRRCRGHW